jgi:DNA-binding beta-propeller fold protein YncE
MSMRSLVALVCVGQLVVACGGSTSLSTPGDKLYVATSAINSQELQVIDSRTHRVEHRLPMGVPSSDWKHLYSIVSTSIVDTNPETGATLATLQIGQSYRFPDATAGGIPGGISPNGGWLVVESFDAPGNDPPTATHFLVIDAPAMKIARRIDLPGFFNFDAISNDGKRLYLIQMIDGKSYYVRWYDLAAGRLDPAIVFDKNEGGNAMTGLRISGVASADGNWQFGMYVRERANPFIHALSLHDPIAFCLDLQGSGYAQDGAAMQWAVALSPDGSTVYAANLGTGDIARIGVSNGLPQVLQRSHVAQALSKGGLIKSVDAKELGGNSAVVSADGHTLIVASSSGVFWIDTEKLAIQRRALADWRIWSVGLSPDGKSVYAVSDGGKIAQLAMSTAAVVTTFDLAGGQPLALMRVAAP